ncbi:hypothetical protein BG011_004669 [Mortierella polycephala]|uniref:polynucleotide adenylyltransferase n=1 Tax=Mortierella polycephala TaxID=41804 RepID=A0A9P6QDI1_9FUNG|nr:hypothetical protein BG011_004669 [Mortierella polycephala]
MRSVQATSQPGTDSNKVPFADQHHKRNNNLQVQHAHCQDKHSSESIQGHSTDHKGQQNLLQERKLDPAQLQHRLVSQSDSNQQDHRPDSPTSLEDSQSESGLDPIIGEPLNTERSMQRFPTADALAAVDSKLTIAKQNSMTINTEATNTNTPTSPTQVATPPLSPTKILSNGVDPKDDDDEQDNLEKLCNNTLHLLQSSRCNDVSRDTVMNSVAKDATHVQLETASTPSQGASTAATPSIIATAAQQSTVSAPAPGSKVSAWSTLLPGVAPIPAPRPNPHPPVQYKSEELRLHERYPIVLPHESEAKLSMEMVDLFEDLLPTQESHERRTVLISKIEKILRTEWPEQDIQAHPFGSTVNDLGTSSSDVDICIMTTWPELTNVQMLANAFQKHGMQKVFCVPRAKVPIVKLWDPELHLSCDMNINTPLGLLNTKLIKTYVAIDPRVRPFAMIIKHWARRRVLNDAANGGTISTYTWICIVINFLQMRSPPILPKLQKKPHTLSEDNQVIHGNNTSFCQDLEELEGFGLPNKETLGGLLYAFFRRFAIEFDYDNHVISVREGCYLTKESKGWHLPGKQYKLFCVEEPFDTSRNLGNSSDMTSSKGLKEEFRRSLDILYHKVSLNLCCAQFVFPPSYYHINNNTRKGINGTTTTNSYIAGRRYYGNGYRSLNHYDEDYDDDDDDDVPTKEVSVMETLNIGTRPSTSKDPLGSSRNNVVRRGSGASSSRGYGGENGGSSKSTSSRDGNQSRNRTKQGKAEKGSTGEASRSGSSRNSKQEKSGASGSPSKRNKKASGGGGDGQKNGRSGSSGGRAPRAAVEFSLAEIANVAPRLLSDIAISEGMASKTSENHSGSATAGEEGTGSKTRKKGGKRSVVWSTNSNRGESSRWQSGARSTQSQPPVHEKSKVIIASNVEEPSGSSAPPSV